MVLADKKGAKQAQVLISETVKKTRTRLSNEPLTEDEVRRLLEGCTDPRDHALLHLGFNSGMRVSEAVRLERISLNEAEGQVTIWDEKKDVYRKVYLPQSTFSTLLRYYNSLQKKSSRLFDFTEKTAENIIQGWSQRILTKKKSWHCVRHTYVTLSAIKQTPISVVMANTGDAAATILKHYTNLPPQLMRKYVEENAIYKE